MNLQIRIKKRSQPEWLVWLLVFVPLLFGTLFDFFALPMVFKYVLDITWVMLLIIAAINFYNRNILINNNHKVLIGWILAFFVFTFLVYIFNYQSVLYYLMGVRNNFRFYFVFISFILFLNAEDIGYYLKVFDAFFWINAVVMPIQYFLFDYKQDSLGGIFGTQSGCNGYLNIFFVIICAKSIIDYLNKNERAVMMLSKCGVSLLLSTFAEIKYFYIEFIVIIITAVLVTSFSWRKLLVIIGGALAVVVAVNLLIIIFPYFSDLFSIEAILESQAKGYSGINTIGRLNAIPTVSEFFLDTIPEKLTGLGLGNCDTSNVDLLNTPFYKEYGYLRYFWFSTAHITLETGYIGFAFFAGFFALIVVLSALEIRKGSPYKTYWQIAIVIAVSSIMIIIYNSSLRTEVGYMIYFILSLPFALQKQVRGVVN